MHLELFKHQMHSLVLCFYCYLCQVISKEFQKDLPSFQRSLDYQVSKDLCTIISPSENISKCHCEQQIFSQHNTLKWLPRFFLSRDGVPLMCHYTVAELAYKSCWCLSLYHFITSLGKWSESPTDWVTVRLVLVTMILNSGFIYF